MENSREDFFQKKRLHILLIAFLGLLAYSNTFVVPFQFDDQLLVSYRAVELKAEAASEGVISMPSARGPWASRPLLYATFVLNNLLGGFNTWGYHVVNITLHLANGILLYFLIAITGKHLGYKENDTLPMALLSALMFLLHPVQTEAVTMVVNRSILMVTAFYLAGIMLFLKAVSSEGETKYNYSIGLFLVSLLGAASREDFVTFPVMLLMYDFFLVSRFRISEVFGHLKAYAAVVPGLILVGFLALTNTYETPEDVAGLMLPPERIIQPLKYVLTEFRVHWTYIRLLIFPVNQVLIYDYPLATSFLSFETIASLFGYAALWVAGVIFSRKRPAAALGVIWFLVTLMPISFAVAFLGLRLGDPIFEHRLYLPSIGLIVLAAIFIVRYAQKRRAFAVALVVLCISLGSASYARNVVWADRLSLWSDTLKKAPNNPRVNNAIAVALKNDGQLDEAIKHYEDAIGEWPNNGQYHSNLGEAYLEKQDVDRAVEHFETAVKLDPNLAYAHERLGLVYELREDHKKALEHYMEIARIAPWETGPLNSAARQCYILGKTEDAINLYILSLRLNKYQTTVLNNLGLLFIETGQTERAIKHLEPLVKLQPDYVPARVALGKLYLELGYALKAIQHLEEARRLSPEDPEIRKVLEEAYSEVKNANKPIYEKIPEGEASGKEKGWR